MNDNLPHLLNISKLTETLALKLPSFQGPWKYTKTSFGQSNPTFILTGKKIMYQVFTGTEIMPHGK